jgi:uncharacterized protein (DUF58 family)
MRAISDLLPPEALARFSNLNLIARWIVEGFISGLHKSPYHGFSVEFAEYRQYVAGDDLRYFDWKALGRSDRKYIKKYHSETNMQAHILLDCSASMKFGEPVSKFKYSTAMAAAIAYLMVLQQDAAGAVLFSDKVLNYVQPKSSMRHFREMVSLLAAAEPQQTTSIHAALHFVAETVKRRGLFVILSDLYDDRDKIIAGLRHLRFKKNEVIVFHVLDHNELKFPYAMLSEFRDMETNERIQVMPASLRAAYLEAIGAFSDDMRRQCSNMDVDYQLIDTSTPFDKVLAQYLHKRQRVR